MNTTRQKCEYLMDQIERKLNNLNNLQRSLNFQAEMAQQKLITDISLQIEHFIQRQQTLLGQIVNLRAEKNQAIQEQEESLHCDLQSVKLALKKDEFSNKRIASLLARFGLADVSNSSPQTIIPNSASLSSSAISTTTTTKITGGEGRGLHNPIISPPPCSPFLSFQSLSNQMRDSIEKYGYISDWQNDHFQNAVQPIKTRCLPHLIEPEDEEDDGCEQTPEKRETRNTRKCADWGGGVANMTTAEKLIDEVMLNYEPITAKNDCKKSSTQDGERRSEKTTKTTTTTERTTRAPLPPSSSNQNEATINMIGFNQQSATVQSWLMMERDASRGGEEPFEVEEFEPEIGEHSSETDDFEVITNFPNSDDLESNKRHVEDKDGDIVRAGTKKETDISQKSTKQGVVSSETDAESCVIGPIERIMQSSLSDWLNKSLGDAGNEGASGASRMLDPIDKINNSHPRLWLYSN